MKLKLWTILLVIITPLSFAAPTTGTTTAAQPKLNFLVTGGLGMNFGINHATVEYDFHPDSINFAGLLGFAGMYQVTAKAKLGLGTRYLYNYIEGDVNHFFDDAAKYSNHIHNILITADGSYSLKHLFKRNVCLHGGLGVNLYKMDLTASKSAFFNGNLLTPELVIDPESNWRDTFAAFVGLGTHRILQGYKIMLSLDYFYLGKMKSSLISKSMPQRDLLEEISFYNHNLLFTVAYARGEQS